jgi:hypothetical protein
MNYIYQNLPLFAALIGLATIQTANAAAGHTEAYMYGYQQGASEGKHPSILDYLEYVPSTGLLNDTGSHIVQFHGHDLNVTSANSYHRCNAGWKAGFNSANGTKAWLYGYEQGVARSTTGTEHIGGVFALSTCDIWGTIKRIYHIYVTL